MAENDRNLFSHSAGAWKSEVRELAGLVLPAGLRDSLLHTFLSASGGLLATLGVLAL